MPALASTELGLVEIALYALMLELHGMRSCPLHSLSLICGVDDTTMLDFLPETVPNDASTKVAPLAREDTSGMEREQLFVI